MATYHPAIGSMFYINWTWFYFTISSFCQLLKQQSYCKYTADKISISLHHHTTDTPLQGSWFHVLEWCFGNFNNLFTNLPMNRAVERVIEAVSCCREVCDTMFHAHFLYTGYLSHVQSVGELKTPSKSHSWLYDVSIYHFKPAWIATLSNFYLSGFANSLVLLINEDLQQKELMEMQWNPKLPLATVFLVGSIFFSSTDSTGAYTFHLAIASNWLLDECNQVSFFGHRMLLNYSLATGT